MNLLEQFEGLSKNHHGKLQEWLLHQISKSSRAILYNSIDVRYSGSQLVHVDNNLFPAGFNNLGSKQIERAANCVQKYFATHFPKIRNILLYPEYHSRNLFYFDNLYNLLQILELAGYRCLLGAAIDEDQEFASFSGHKILIHSIKKVADSLLLGKDFTPDLVLLNNDMTAGPSGILLNLAIPVIPHLCLGWHNRRKSNHFVAYNEIASEFEKEFKIKKELISCEFKKCDSIDFRKAEGFECLARNTDSLLKIIKHKYDLLGIKHDPYVFIKSDYGTYGMAIMTAHSGDEVIEMNKKSRHKMSNVKGGVVNNDVIIQEGVRTIVDVNGGPAEQMIYSIGLDPIAYILRVNKNKDTLNNLNSTGMEFVLEEKISPLQNASFVIAQLAYIAACIEKNY